MTVGGTTTTTRFALDGWNPALAGEPGNANWNVWADLNASNALQTRYFRGDLVDQLFARIDSGTAYWELTDHVASTRTIIDNTSVVKDQITYDGWGNATQTNSSYGGRYLWTGREFDVTTGLQYNRGRYYDPASGKWISQDPLGLLPDSNPYRYVRNQVAQRTDPSGLLSAFETVIAIERARLEYEQAIKAAWAEVEAAMGALALNPVGDEWSEAWFAALAPIFARYHEQVAAAELQLRLALAALGVGNGPCGNGVPGGGPLMPNPLVPPRGLTPLEQFIKDWLWPQTPTNPNPQDNRTPRFPGLPIDPDPIFRIPLPGSGRLGIQPA